MSKNSMIETIGVAKPARVLNDPCYRLLLEASNSAVLFLSSESIILEWNRAAETISGWIAAEVLGRSYVELCLPMKARESFLSKLAQVTQGREVRGFESPFCTCTGSEMMFSWNITRVPGTQGSLIGLMAVGTVVVPNTQAEEELRLAHAKLRNEACQVQSAVEEERRRIARELHDEFGQALTGLKFDLAWFGRTLAQLPVPISGEAVLNKVQAMSGTVDALLESVRATAAALRPAMLDDLGLVPALECLVTRLQHRTGARCSIDVAPGLSSIALPSETSAALFRIAQELLTNVMRHASASKVHMRLYQDGARVTLEVTDNGKGITRERMATLRSFGLRGMQERAALLGGHVHIAGTSGAGTRAIASVPVGRCVVS
jgi:PAS domain S-box-containing protein